MFYLYQIKVNAGLTLSAIIKSEQNIFEIIIEYEMNSLHSPDQELFALTSYRSLLSAEFSHRKIKNPTYSLRAMARDLKISPATLSSILKQKSHFQLDTVNRVASCFNRSLELSKYFTWLAYSEILSEDVNSGYYREKAQKIRFRNLFVQVEVPHQSVDRWPLSLLALSLLIRIESVVKEDASLAKRLQITPEVLSDLFDELEKIGWIQRTSNGTVSHVTHIKLGDKGSAYQIKNLNRKTLEHAITSIENVPFEHRSYYNCFFSMDPARFAEVSENVTQFALSTAEREGPAHSGHEVFVLGTYLIPISSQPLT